MRHAPEWYWLNIKEPRFSQKKFKAAGIDFWRGEDKAGRPKRLFADMPEGSRLVVYEGAPVMAVVGEAVVRKGWHVEHVSGHGLMHGVTLEYVRDVGPIPRQLLVIHPQLQGVAALKKGSQGGLFRLEETDFYTIMDIAEYPPKGLTPSVKELGFLDGGLLHVLDYVYLGSLTAGRLVLQLSARASQGVITVYGPKSKPYDQWQFERDLRELYGALSRLRFAFGSLTLVFGLGGDLLLPEWFLEALRHLGVRVVVVEDVPGVINELQDNKRAWARYLGLEEAME